MASIRFHCHNNDDDDDDDDDDNKNDNDNDDDGHDTDDKNDEQSKTTARLTQRDMFKTIFRLARPAFFRFRCY